MDYMYYLMKYNKERELSNFEKAVNLIFRLKDDDKMRDKISDELKDYTTYCTCAYEKNPLPKEKHYMKKIMNEGYSCYYFSFYLASYFDKVDKRNYKRNYNEIVYIINFYNVRFKKIIKNN